MERNRIALALEKIPPGAWENFEHFASEFLASEFPELRTLARASGDRGRDAEIYDATPDGKIKLQYSVTADWSGKITKTAKRISETSKAATVLIYATNREIGAAGDEIKAKTFTKYKLVVDIRDCSWFVERRNKTQAVTNACEDLAKIFVDPLLQEKGIREIVAPALSIGEEKLAFLQLSIDLMERSSDKNLTKSSFESLVLAVLYGTTHNTAISRDEISNRISNIVGHGTPGQVQAQINGALDRLSGKKIKFIRKINSYHLAFEESVRIADRSETFLKQEQDFERDILAAIYGISADVDDSDVKAAEVVCSIRRFMEAMLLDYGEQFSEALTSSTGIPIVGELEERLTAARFSTHISNSRVAEAIVQVIEEGSEETKSHLRQLLDAYTVLSVLKATPDVHKVLKKIFSGGQIWLDTSFILPILAESFRAGEKPLSAIVDVCRHTDIELLVTHGIIEEIDSHLHSCLQAVRNPRRPRAPYLLTEYVMEGHRLNTFPSWQEDIRGANDPLTDIEEYLSDELGIKVRDLDEQVSQAPDDMREAVTEYWRQKTESRRAGSIDILNVDRLAAHDVETTLGVIQLRGKDRKNVSGYRHWVITLDKAARGLSAYLESEIGQVVPTPVMNPSYLSQLLRFNPGSSPHVQQQLNRIPVMLDMIKVDGISEYSIQRVGEIRGQIPTTNSRRMRRLIRDTMNNYKASGEGTLEAKLLPGSDK